MSEGDITDQPTAEIPVDAVETQSSGVASSQRQVTIEQLTAAHALLSDDRAADVHDIIITTVMEALRNGPRSEQALLEAALRIWPGTALDGSRIRQSLKIAEKIGYVVPVRGVASTWDLTANGRSEIDTSGDWAREIVDTTARQVKAQLKQAGRDITDKEAELWTSVLRQVLMAGISGMLAPYSGDIQRSGDHLTVRSWDRAGMQRVVDATLRGDDRDVMMGLAADAFDVLSPFGNELVTTIIAGYVVHAYVGRRDRAAARAVVGSLRGNRVILEYSGPTAFARA